MTARKPAIYSLAAMLLAASLFTPEVLANSIFKVTNVSPSPLLTNEFYLTATNITVSINGSSVRVLVYKDDPPGGGGAPAQIPGPLIEAMAGQTIICHFKNKLTNNIEGASIHWHGIELDNDSDGTAVTQDTILPGQTYNYRFVVPRPGVCWYHSHMIPGTTTFGGMYGPIIIHDTNETALVATNVLPPASLTFPLVLSDISFTNGAVGKVYNGTNFSLNTLIQLCENNILGNPNPDGGACAPAELPGDVFMCNGSVPVRSGSLCTPTTNSAPVFYISNNQRVRLQLINASISRNTYLTLRYPCSNPTGDTNLYHIGGQGGLLDDAVLDGGVQSGYDFQCGKGTVNLGAGARSDVMFYSSGNNGDVIQLVGNPLPSPWNLSGGFVSNYPVAFFVITNGGSTNLPLADASPILTAVGAANEDLRLLNTNSLAQPPSTSLGARSMAIQFENGIPDNGVAAGPNIGGYAATPLDGNSGFGSWPSVPHPPTALWARDGTVLQLAIANNTGSPGGGGGAAVHTYHLHGFSMQPVSIYSANLQTNLYNFSFNQFLDTYDIKPGEALVFRIKLTDRPVCADTATGGPVTLASDAPSGGAIGRWLMHCHTVVHEAVGMISELVVVPNKFTRLVGPQAGTNSVLLAAGFGVPWTATNSVSWLHLLPGSGNGTGNATVLFSYDANSGPPRVGTLHVGGATVEVTQAGTNYIQAPGPVTVLTTSVNGPDGIAVDSRGFVYYADSGNHALKRWNPSANTTTTLASGIGTPQGIALDGLGNVYFADFSGTVVKKWSPDTSLVTPVFTNTSSGMAGMAADSSGNVYITDPGDKAVKQWSPATGTLASYTTNGLVGPYGVAVDALGGIYVADTTDNAVKKLGIHIISVSPLIIIPYWNTLVSSNYLNSPWNLSVDDGGNIYIADGFHNAIKRWNADDGTVDTLVSSGLGDPTGVAVDNTGNVFISDFNNDRVKELPYAFLDPRPRYELAEMTADKLPGILLPTQNLLPPFAPTPNASWIFYGGSTTGVVQFALSANTGGPRSGSLTVLGQGITINQDGPPPTVFTDISMLTNGVFRLSFTNGVQTGVYSVLFSTNLLVPTSNWIVIGTATTNGAGIWQFTDYSASNGTRFYRIRSP